MMWGLHTLSVSLLQQGWGQEFDLCSLRMQTCWVWCIPFWNEYIPSNLEFPIPVLLLFA